jgi:hypothetical protein
MVADCDISYEGVCSQSGCVCEEPECPECRSDDDCMSVWASCSGGTCWPCGELDIPWDAELGCSIPIEEFDDILVPYTNVDIDGLVLPYVDDCANFSEGWFMGDSPSGSIIELCSASCTAFEAAGMLTISWCIAGE